MSGIYHGTIKRLVRDRGFGFVAAPDGREFFFHRSALTQGALIFETLEEGQAVTFDEEPSAKDPRAGNVEVRHGASIRTG